MIEEVLKKVSSSEETAKKIRAESDEKAAGIRAQADRKAAEIKGNGTLDSRVNAKMSVAVRFEEEKKKYRAEAEKFKAENSGKAEEAAEMLFGRIKNGDC